MGGDGRLRRGRRRGDGAGTGKHVERDCGDKDSRERCNEHDGAAAKRSGRSRLSAVVDLHVYPP